MNFIITLMLLSALEEKNTSSSKSVITKEDIEDIQRNLRYILLFISPLIILEVINVLIKLVLKQP